MIIIIILILQENILQQSGFIIVGIRNADFTLKDCSWAVCSCQSMNEAYVVNRMSKAYCNIKIQKKPVSQLQDFFLFPVLCNDITICTVRTGPHNSLTSAHVSLWTLNLSTVTCGPFVYLMYTFRTVSAYNFCK